MTHGIGQNLALADPAFERGVGFLAELHRFGFVKWLVLDDVAPVSLVFAYIAKRVEISIGSDKRTPIEESRDVAWIGVDEGHEKILFNAATIFNRPFFGRSCKLPMNDISREASWSLNPPSSGRTEMGIITGLRIRGA